MKKLVLLMALLVIMSFGALYGTMLLTDDFTGTAGTNLTANGWTALTTGAGSTPLTIASPGLTYSGYIGSAIGNATSASGNGEDIFKTFTSTTTGSVYYATMVTASPSVTTAGYGIHFSPNGSLTNTTFYGRFWIQKDTTTGLQFGVSKLGNSPVYTGYNYTTGTTYLIVVKYTFNTGSTTDDVISLFVNPTLGGAEPTPTLTVTETATTDATTLAALGIRQWNAGALARWDGIRVATTWADIAPAANTGSIDTYGTTSLTFSTPVGVTSATQTYDLEGVDTTTDITITAPAHWELYSDETGWGNPIVVTSAYKTISVRYTPVAAGTETGNIVHVAGNADDVNIALSGTGTTVASITATPNTLTYSTNAGSSAVQSYHLKGTNLTENIAVTAPTNYMVSTSASGPWTATLSLAASYDANVYVQFTPPGYGAFNGTLTNVANAITTNVSLTGTGTSANMNIGIDTSVSQDFAYIGTSALATLPTDWKADKQTTARVVGTYGAALTATERQGGNLLSSSAGNGIYNFGAGDAATATERCVGFLSSSSATKSGNLYVKLTNSAVSALTALDISYAVEKYRMGTNAVGFQVQMYYSLDDVTYTPAGVDFLNAWAADATTEGYAAAPGDVQNVTNKRVGVTIPAGGNVYLAWNYSVQTGSTTSFAQALGIDDITITGRQVPICEIPTFSPLPGNYYTSQSVTLSCATSGAAIHYTTNGDTPTIASPVYSTPISVTATTTIKAIATKTGYDNSAVAVGLYRIPINVANIAALRAGVADNTTLYRLTGEAILTLQSSVTTGTPAVTTKNKYIQDASGAIQIYDPNPPKMTTSYNLGDGITGIIGALTLYANMLEFVPVTDAGAASSTGHTVAPINVTLAALDASYQAKLIHVTNVSIDPAAVSPFAASTNYVITDPSGAGVLRTAYADLDYIGAPFTTSPMDYTGICLQYNTALQLVPRSLAEITVSASVVPPENVVITVVGADIQLDWDAVSGATSYKIQVSDAPNGTFTDLTTSPTNTVLLADEADTYGIRFYQIRAVQ